MIWKDIEWKCFSLKWNICVCAMKATTIIETGKQFLVFTLNVDLPSHHCSIPSVTTPQLWAELESISSKYSLAWLGFPKNHTMTMNDPVFCADDISVDNKPWSGSGHHGVKSEYTLPGDSGVQSSGAGAGGGDTLPDSSGHPHHTLPPLMHMGYVGRWDQSS